MWLFPSVQVLHHRCFFVKHANQIKRLHDFDALLNVQQIVQLFCICDTLWPFIAINSILRTLGKGERKADC